MTALALKRDKIWYWYSALAAWNNFLIPLTFTRPSNSQPLNVVLTLFIGQYEVAKDMAAGAVLTILPPFLMALFLQRHLVQGLTMGAVKQDSTCTRLY